MVPDRYALPSFDVWNLFGGSFAAILLFMEEQWQLYNEDATPIDDRGATQDEVFGKGLLHGAAHVWMWRNTPKGPEVLLQRRAANKRTYPNLLDISAAGHIDLDESPDEAAIREAKEEIGLDVLPSQLKPIGKHRKNVTTENGDTENEYCWLYIYEITDETPLKLQVSEVAETKWIPLTEFIQTILPNNGNYVPQGDNYYEMVIKALKQATGSTPTTPRQPDGVIKGDDRATFMNLPTTPVNPPAPVPPAPPPPEPPVTPNE